MAALKPGDKVVVVGASGGVGQLVAARYVGRWGLASSSSSSSSSSSLITMMIPPDAISLPFITVTYAPIAHHHHHHHHSKANKLTLPPPPRSPPPPPPPPPLSPSPTSTSSLLRLAQEGKYKVRAVGRDEASLREVLKLEGIEYATANSRESDSLLSPLSDADAVVIATGKEG